MLQSIQGVYKHGKIELAELPADVSESLVIVTFLESIKANQPPVERQIIQFGMFSANKQSTEEDF